MISSLLVVVCVLAATPGVDSSQAATPSDLSAYKEAKAKVGRDADAHIRLALWCESHGMVAERTKHLTIATLIDPANATARGLLGMVQYQGKWLSPDAVGERIQADPEKQARIREYLERRVKAADKPDDQMKLALWCDQNDLKDQATAHFHRAVQLDPGRELAWKHLGYKKEKGRWVKPEQLAAEREVSELQAKANKHWKPILERLRHGLESRIPDDRAKAESRIAEFKDPAAVPMIWATFAQRDARHQEVAVKLLAQIDAPTASQALAMLSIVGRSADVKRHAVEALKPRDPRDFVEVLTAMIRKPIEYEVRHKAGLNSPGEIVVKGVKKNLKRIYTSIMTPDYIPQNSDVLVYDSNGLPVISRTLGIYASSLGTIQLRATEGQITDSDVRSFLAHPRYLDRPTTPGPGGANGTAQLSPGLTAALTKAGLPASAVENLSKVGYTGEVFISGPEQGVKYARVGEVYTDQVNIPLGQMALDAQLSAQDAQRQLDLDVQQIEAYNAPLRDANRAARQVLGNSTGVDLGDDPEPWQRWSANLMGLSVVDAKYPSNIPTLTEEVSPQYEPQAMTTFTETAIGLLVVRFSCFAAGTSVRTVDGPRPIETLMAGDRVLTQNTTTGRIGFSPVLTAYHNPPDLTYKIHFESEDEPVVATGIHRFWKVGEGWAMARDLRPGDVLRSIGGVAKVASIKPDTKQPVFNLRVAEGESFFVGDLGVLAHDNSLPTPVDKPFDRVVGPELASSTRK